MSVTVKHTSAALTDILLAADKLWEGCLSDGGRDSHSTSGRDMKRTPKPQKPHRLTKHCSCDGSHHVGNRKAKWFEVGAVHSQKSGTCSQKARTRLAKRRTSHTNPALAYSNRAWGMEGLSPKTLIKCLWHVLFSKYSSRALAITDPQARWTQSVQRARWITC